jgi:hypothetical protein
MCGTMNFVIFTDYVQCDTIIFADFTSGETRLMRALAVMICSVDTIGLLRPVGPFGRLVGKVRLVRILTDIRVVRPVICYFQKNTGIEPLL